MHGNNFQQWKDNLYGVPHLQTVGAGGFKDGFAVPLWEKLPRAQFDQLYLAGTREQSLRSNDNYTFAQVDRGGVSFRVRNSPHQLMINLGNYQSDILAPLVIVGRGPNSGVLMKTLNPDILGPFSSGALIPRYQYTQVPNVRYDERFFLPDQPTDMWLSYDMGRIRVGLGQQPDTGRVILDTQLTHANPGVQKVSFGRWRAGDTEHTIIENVQMWRKNYQ